MLPKDEMEAQRPEPKRIGRRHLPVLQTSPAVCHPRAHTRKPVLVFAQRRAVRDSSCCLPGRRLGFARTPVRPFNEVDFGSQGSVLQKGREGAAGATLLWCRGQGGSSRRCLDRCHERRGDVLEDLVWLLADPAFGLGEPLELRARGNEGSPTGSRSAAPRWPSVLSPVAFDVTPHAMARFANDREYEAGGGSRVAGGRASLVARV
jgi:hypothetical protein